MQCVVDLSRLISKRRVIAPAALDRGRKKMVQFLMSPLKRRELKRNWLLPQPCAPSLDRSVSGGLEAVFCCAPVRTTTILDYIVRTDTIQPGDDFAQRKLADGLVERLVTTTKKEKEWSA